MTKRPRGRNGLYETSQIWQLVCAPQRQATRWRDGLQKRSKSWDGYASSIPRFAFPISGNSCRHFAERKIVPGWWMDCGKQDYRNDGCLRYTEVPGMSGYGTSRKWRSSRLAAAHRSKADPDQPSTGSFMSSRPNPQARSNYTRGFDPRLLPAQGCQAFAASQSTFGRATASFTVNHSLIRARLRSSSPGRR